MRALKEENKKIPQDISIITFDDHPYLDYLATPLTCVAQPVSDISKIATKFLFSKLNNKEIKINQVLLKPEIKVKESLRRLG
jgi:LacI family transcriptional regulator